MVGVFGTSFKNILTQEVSKIGTHAKNRTYKYTMPRVKQPRVKAIKQLANVKQPSVPDNLDGERDVGAVVCDVRPFRSRFKLSAGADLNVQDCRPTLSPRR